MRYLPKTVPQAIRHLSTVEVDVTPLTDVFCLPLLEGGSSIMAVKRAYKQLALKVHPDRVGSNEKRASTKCMGTLSRALEQVKLEMAYEKLRDGTTEEKFVLEDDVVFSRTMTGKEEYVRDHERRTQRAEEKKEVRRKEKLEEARRKEELEEARRKEEMEKARREEERQKARRKEDMENRRREEDKDRKARRSLQKKRSKQRSLERAKAALMEERVASMTWKPSGCVPITPVVGMTLDARWKCDQLVRAYNAYLGVRKGVNIRKTLVKLSTKCRVASCSGTLVFDRQPRSGHWKLNKYTEHSNECFGRRVPGNSSQSPARGSAQYCAPAYTAQQVARAILDEAGTDSDISLNTISGIVKARRIYKREPPYAHYRMIKRELMKLA